MWNPFASTPDDPNKEPSPGVLTESLANPWVSIPTAIGLGLLSGATPGTARIARGLSAGAEMGLNAEKGAYERLKQKRLSDAIKGMAGATSPKMETRIGVNPDSDFSVLSGGTDEPDSDRRLSDIWGGKSPLASAAPLPTYSAMVEKPQFSPRQQEFLKAVPPEIALRALSSAIFKEPQGYHFDRNPITGELTAVDKANLASTVIRPGTPGHKTHIVSTVDKEGNKIQKLMTEEEMRSAGDIPAFVAEPRDRSFNTNDLAAYVGSGGKIRGATIPEGMPLDVAKATLNEIRSIQQQNINIRQEQAAKQAVRAQRIPDQDRRTIGNIDTTVQQIKEIERTFKLTPAYKTGTVSDALKAAIATNEKARVLDQLGLLPVESLNKEEKDFAAAYNTMILKLRTVSGDNRFSDQDATRAIRGIGSGLLGKDLPIQLNATKDFLERERENIILGLEDQGFNTRQLRQRSSGQSTTQGMNDLPTPPAGKMLIENLKTGDRGFYPVGDVPPGFKRIK